MEIAIVNNKVQDKLKVLFDEYASKLPKKINTLEKEWEDLQSKKAQIGLVDFHRNIHSLCGSAATYGYYALSQAARQLESYLKILIKKNISISKEQEQEINFLFHTKIHNLNRGKSSGNAKNSRQKIE